MKKQQEVMVVRRSRSGWLTVIKALLILAGLVFIAVKLYDKFVAKKQKPAELPKDEDADGTVSEAAENAAEEESAGLSASASDVITNPENMD